MSSEGILEFLSQLLWNCGEGLSSILELSQLWSSKMPMTDSKKFGISTLYFSAYLLISCLACLKLSLLFLFLICKNAETVISASMFSVVLLSTKDTTSSTIFSSNSSDLQSFCQQVKHLERSEFIHTFTLPSLSIQIISSTTLKYPTVWYSFSKPSRALNRRQRFSGKGMSCISLSQTGICSMYTLALYELLQQSLACQKFRYFVLTMQSSLSLQAKNSRYLLNSARLSKSIRCSSNSQLVSLLTRHRYLPCSGLGWRAAGGFWVQFSRWKEGGLQLWVSLLPIIK